MAATYQGKPSDFSWLRTVALGTAADLRKDFRWFRHHHKLSQLPAAARIRFAQRSGKLAGFRQGWLDYQRQSPA
jgi:rhamnosyltransferase